ncbi:hypothetical protein ACZ90_29525 [Streptomyces albus subsp. albus]|nr:hypothetical protein ACZ90_29525 [Streptomyces albus subsp. albus]
MRKVARNSLMTVAAAGSVLAATAGYANAVGAGAHGAASDSPGVASGNTVQVPVDIPVNVCGNTINVVGLLNPALGNSCRNESGTHTSGGHSRDTHGSHSRGGSRHGGGSQHDGGQRGGSSHDGGASAEGRSEGSPGILSGNTVQVPIDIPVNVCGNSVDVIGIGNGAVDNDCENGAEAPSRPHRPTQPPRHKPHAPKEHQHSKAPEHHSRVSHRAVQDPQLETEQLAHTGAGSLGVLAPASAGALLAGAVLYRRARARQH